MSNKFGARKAYRTLDDGRVLTFASQAEARRYDDLVLLERAGVIAELELQPSFKVGRKTERAIIYIADFRYRELDSGLRIVEDVKSVVTKTAAFGIKRRLFLYQNPDIVFRIVE